MVLWRFFDFSRRIPVACALVIFALAFSACGGGGGGAADNILHRGNGAEPATLDPHLMTGHPEFAVAWALFEGLTRLDPKTLDPVPAVAERWDVSPDGRTVTFFLRPTAKWSNGDRVLAPDFVFAWRRILEPGLAAPYAGCLFCIEGAEAFHQGKAPFESVGIETPDRLVLRVRLVRPTPHFLYMQAMPFFFPLHAASLLEHGAADRRDTPWTRPGNLVSNGAFQLTGWQPNRILSVRRNPNYRDAAAVRLEGVDFHPIGSLQTEERAFRTGRLQMTNSLPPGKIAVYRKDAPELLHIAPMFGAYFYRFNTTRKPLDDVRVRRALAMSIDRDDIVEHVARGGQLPAGRFVPPIGTYPGGQPIPYDIEAARRLLAEAGYPGGQGFPKLSILYNTSEGHRAIAQAVQHMWKTRLGIDIEMVNQDWKVFLNTVKELDYDIARGSWIGDYYDPMAFLETMTSGSEHNRSGWRSEPYDKIVARALDTADATRRLAMLAEAETILLADAPVAPVYYYAGIRLIASDLQGAEPNAMDYLSFRDMFFTSATVSRTASRLP